MRIVSKAIRGSPAPYPSEPAHGLPARLATCSELVAHPRLPPRPGRDRLPDPGELPPPLRPSRIPPRRLPGHGFLAPGVRPPRVLGRRLPAQPRGPLRGDRFLDPRPRPLPPFGRSREVEAASPVRHPPPRRRPRVRRRRDPREAVRPGARGGDRREP